MKTIAILFGFLALISVAYTLDAKEQKEDVDKDVKSFMEQLMRGVVMQMQEDDDKQSSVELQSAMRDLLGEVEEEDDDGVVESALLQDESEAREEGDDILALLQDEDEEEGDGVQVQEEDDGDVETQGWFRKIFSGIRKFGGRVNRICKKVNRYTRYTKCLPRMQAEMQKADDGDEELAKDLLKRIANVQEDDVEAQFFKRIFKRARKVWGRGRRWFKKIRRGIGRVYRGYRNIKRCFRRYG